MSQQNYLNTTDVDPVFVELANYLNTTDVDLVFVELAVNDPPFTFSDGLGIFHYESEDQKSFEKLLRNDGVGIVHYESEDQKSFEKLLRKYWTNAETKFT
eukprot:gene1661-33057_t